MEHELKCWPEYFEDVMSGRKPFEVRIDDRPYHSGDTLRLREWLKVEKCYTGREVRREVTYVLHDPAFCKTGYVVLGLAHSLQSPFRNDPFSVVAEVFESLYPGRKYNAFLSSEPMFEEDDNGDAGKEFYGYTAFSDDGSIAEIVVYGGIALTDSVEVFAHELAHVAVGPNVEQEHGEEWEAAFQAIHTEYTRRADQGAFLPPA